MSVRSDRLSAVLLALGVATFCAGVILFFFFQDIVTCPEIVGPFESSVDDAKGMRFPKWKVFGCGDVVAVNRKAWGAALSVFGLVLAGFSQGINRETHSGDTTG